MYAHTNTNITRARAHTHTHPRTHAHTHARTHTHTHAHTHTHTEEQTFRAARMESEILAQPTLLMNLVPVIAQILEACFESTWISLSFRSLGDDYLTDHSTNSGGQVQLKGVRASDMIG